MAAQVVTILLVFLVFVSAASTSTAQVKQCEYVMIVNTGPTKGPMQKLKTIIEAVGGRNINTTNLIKRWGDMGKGYAYFLPDSQDRFRHQGPCLDTRFCNIMIRKKGELLPPWYINNITVTTKGDGIDMLRTFRADEEYSFSNNAAINLGECP